MDVDHFPMNVPAVSLLVISVKQMVNPLALPRRSYPMFSGFPFHGVWGFLRTPEVHRLCCWQGLDGRCLVSPKLT